MVRIEPTLVLIGQGLTNSILIGQDLANSPFLSVRTPPDSVAGGHRGRAVCLGGARVPPSADRGQAGPWTCRPHGQQERSVMDKETRKNSAEIYLSFVVLSPPYSFKGYGAIFNGPTVNPGFKNYY